MSTIISSAPFLDDNPLDIVERVAGAADLSFERFDDEDLLRAHHIGPSEGSQAGNEKGA
ncbi:MAG: hypothetical protein IH991_23190, partial [Planctomycetes bacterium]|nr:hypothetical protein [Planctomycetota bacterium]